MDTLTHALSGALLARATAPRDAPPNSLPRRIAAGFFACAAPDLDIAFLYGGPVEYVLNHRGITHSFVLLPLWAFAAAWVLAKVLREPRGWRALYGVSALAIGAHIVGDVITSYGTMVLAPLSDWRAVLGTTFIIDLWLSGIILAGLAASAVLLKSRMPSVVATALLVAYVGFQYAQRQRAIEFGREYIASRGLAAAAVTVHPRPLSPFNWTVYVSDEEKHRFAHVNLFRTEARSYRPGEGFIAKIDAPYLPLSQAVWVTRFRYGETQQELARDAWNSDALGFYRWFADLPAFDGVTEGSSCVWFVDLRFLTPGRDITPFPFGACHDRPGSPWRAYEREGAGKVPVR